MNAVPDAGGYKSPAAPLRVLWAIKGLGPGGAEQLLVSLAGAHDPSLVQLEVVRVLDWKDHLVADLEAAGVLVHSLGVARGADPRWLPRLVRLLRQRRPDVVHVHSPLVAAVARPLVRLGLAGRPRPAVVTTEHNAWSTFAVPTRVANAVTAPLDDAVLAVSEEVRSSMRPAALRRRAEVVVHGVDLDAADRARADRAAARAELGVADGEVLVLTVANYRPQKAYPDLLDAARAVVDRGLPVRFAAVGQGPERDVIEQRHRDLGLGDRFLLLGYRRDIPRLLAAADVFTLASRFEGYPVALMEALAAGLPVVATAVGGVADAVTEGVEGRLVAAGDVTALAAALAATVDDADGRAAMAAAARTRATAFDIRRAARHLERCYDRVRPQSVRGAVRA
jgi:glycosyltransferase involved in cell wall biosynthesis